MASSWWIAWLMVPIFADHDGLGWKKPDRENKIINTRISVRNGKCPFIMNID
jgi:hypothetical protein